MLGVTILMVQTFFQIAKIVARESTAHLQEPLHAKNAAPRVILVPPLSPAQLAPEERFSLTLPPATSL
jgi:hypothetical protein